jgi:glycosyltransferase involved in cell wall biosynthesis
MNQYGLVHLVTGGDFSRPLVASQVFDHAQVQAETPGPDAPQHIEVWLIEPMRAVFTKRKRVIMDELRRRCPQVKIRLFGGIGRLDSWPALALIARSRRQSFGRLPVVYHCRGESAAHWGTKLRQIFPSDAVVLDVRGVWPAELLYERGVHDPAEAAGKDLLDYLRALRQLRHAVVEADAITTVSHGLRDWLMRNAEAPAQTTVIGCCVRDVTGDEWRLATRTRWGIRGELTLVYSGTTASYQHLADLLLPFMRTVLMLTDHVRAVLLTPECEDMRRLAAQAGLDTSRTIIESHSQTEVAKALTGGDIGLLLRRPTLVNRVSQPTKVGEYFAAGLPLAIEQGTGGVPPSFEHSQAGITVRVAGPEPLDMVQEARRVLEWIGRTRNSSRIAARQLAASEFTWRSVLPKARSLYIQALQTSDARVHKYGF